MIIDTSAIIAILAGEAEAPVFAKAIKQHRCAISAATLLETEIVVSSRLGRDAVRDLRLALQSADVEIVPFDARQAEIASEAYLRFGRGSAHPAKLNYGDCFSYALAILRDEPLLYKGDDFAHTDVRPAE